MKHVAGFIAALLLAAATTGWAQEAKPDVWPMVDKAVGLIGEKKLDDARGLAEGIVKLAPAHPMGHALLIDLAEKVGEPAAVVEACDALVAVMPVGPDVKKPDPLRRHQLWRYHANRHKGEALMRLKRYAEAAKCFTPAADMAYQAARPMDARQTLRWQIRMKDRAAAALWQAGRKDESVALRKQILARYDAHPQGHNNCLRVRRGLCDDTDSLQAMRKAVAEDPRYDAVQKAWFRAATMPKPWRPPAATDRLTARKLAGELVIRSEGRFELRVDLGKERCGYIRHWYDLETDPLRELDLLGGNYFTMLKPHHVSYAELREGKWQHVDYNRYVQLRKAGRLGVGVTKEQNAVEVLETGPARVRWRYTNRKWPGETVAYTVYPDGRIYVGTRWKLVNPDKTIRIHKIGFYCGVSGTVNWRTTIGKLTGMFGSPYIQAKAPFTMMHSNENYPCALESTAADVALARRTPSNSYGNNTLFLAWFRSPVSAGFDPTRQTRADEAVFIHIWPNDRDSVATEGPFVSDFQQPAKATVTVGALVTDDAGDFDGDGYNESEGCYVVRAGNATAAVALDAAVPRCSPIVKVLGTGGKDVAARIEGKGLAGGAAFATYVDPKSGTAIVRLRGRLEAPAKIVITVK